MENYADFKIDVVGNLIKVKICGTWTIQADLAYLTELGAQIQKMRGKPWAMLVDMRGWVMPEDLYNSKFKSKLSLDRRNQKVECWIVDDPKQGSFLHHFIEASGVPFKCFQSQSEAKAWMQGFGFEC
jgi:hypothetical protein